MSNRQTESLTAFQREIVKRAQASLALEGCTVSDEEALVIGQEFFGSREAEAVEQSASALRTHLNSIATSIAADTGRSTMPSKRDERLAHSLPESRSYEKPADRP